MTEHFPAKSQLDAIGRAADRGLGKILMPRGNNFLALWQKTPSEHIHSIRRLAGARFSVR